MKRSLHLLFRLIFWSWNAVFLAFVGLGLAPFIAPFLLLATLEGRLPVDFSLTLLAIVVVPFVCTLLGALRLKNEPIPLIRLFYGVEAPLVCLCLVRLFLLRELTPASTHILLSLGGVILAFAAELFYGYAARKPAIAWAQLLAHSLMLLVGVYVGAVLLFYAVPLAGWLIQRFVEFHWLGWLAGSFQYGFGSFIVLSFTFLLLVAVSGSLFVAMPSAMTTLYLHSGQRVWRSFAAQYGRSRAVAGTIGITVASLILFVAFQQQPQLEAFRGLERSPTTDREKQALLAKSDQVRSGLLNAYLANYRYLSTEPENNHVKAMYRTVGASEDVAQGLQNLYNRLMSPFLYQGSAKDSEKADRLYEQFFDTAIQKAEPDAINHALQSTYNQDEAKAGLLNFNQQKVWLRSQELSVQESGDWASLELHEVYDNQTPDQQEVFYSFSLPESAVITGLWLGDTGDRAKRFPYVVSPRGAAQKIYNQQVEVRSDPALLEQVGPWHYRLRAFPVPPPASLGIPTADRPTEMHLWMTYDVMRQEQGWALPHLGEKRNLYWTDKTQRLRNGQPAKSLNAWLEAFLPAAQPGQPIAHQTLFPGYQVSAQPLRSTDYRLPQNQRFAVILDTSRSMSDRGKDLQQAFDWLKVQGFANATLSDNDADLYLTAATGAAPQRLNDLSAFDPKRFTFYGTVQLGEMLQQFTQLRGETRYDGILLLTDAGSYELASDRATQTAMGQPAKPKLPAMPAPLWMVHLGGLPPAYDDDTLAAIETSRGGVSTNLTEVLYRTATQTAQGRSTVSVVDGYAWKLDNRETAPSGNDRFAPLAARQLILGLSRIKDVGQVADLDAIHAIAKRFSIVTPYSSMIVLVNDAQRKALREAEAQNDRFDRTVESGKEQLTKPFNPLSQEAIPEPSTLLGLGIAAATLLGLRRRNRRQHS